MKWIPLCLAVLILVPGPRVGAGRGAWPEEM